MKYRNYYYSFNNALKALPALNLTVLEAAIWISSPVCGFLPTLAALSAGSNDPNPAIWTLSPALIADSVVFTNDLISSMQVFDKVTLKPVIINFCVLVFYIVLFVLVNNIVSKRKEAID